MPVTRNSWATVTEACFTTESRKQRPPDGRMYAMQNKIKPGKLNPRLM